MSETQLDSDWPAQVVKYLEDFVNGLKSKTTTPLHRVATFVVYGLMAFGLAIVLLLLTVVLLTRFLEVFAPTWSVYMGLGALFIAGGFSVWSKRK